MTTAVITIDIRHGPLPIAVTLECEWEKRDGLWEPTRVDWADVTVWPNCDQGQLYRPNDWSRLIEDDWLRWLKELDPPTCIVHYGERRQETMTVQDAVEEAWLRDKELA